MWKAAFLGMAILAAGCGGRPVPLGTFRGKRPLAVAPGTDPVIAGQLQRVELRLSDSGKAVLEDGGVPWEGLASRHGDELEIEVLAIDGVNIDRQPAGAPRTLRLRIGKDGGIVYANVRMERVGGS